MSQIKMDNEDIAEIKNALTIVILNADMGVNIDKVIQKQAKRIDNLLPKVAFEGGKQCQQLKKDWNSRNAHSVGGQILNKIKMIYGFVFPAGNSGMRRG